MMSSPLSPMGTGCNVSALSPAVDLVNKKNGGNTEATAGGVSTPKAAASVAFRRPATKDEIERFSNLADAISKRGNNFERSMQIALQAVLVSPHFLFRFEKDAAPNDPTAKHTVGDY